MKTVIRLEQLVGKVNCQDDQGDQEQSIRGELQATADHYYPPVAIVQLGSSR
jgi:hypothetical protein